MSSISIVRSNKGNNKLFIDGFDYYLDNKTKNIFRWSCSQRKSKNCKCRVDTIIVDGNHVVQRNANQHFHDPQAFKKPICEKNAEIKVTAKNSTLCPSKIISDSVVETQANCRRYLPSNEAQRQKILRIRKKSIKEPTNLNDIKIPDSLKFIESELFVLSEKEFVGERLILLGTKKSIKLLGECKCWIMDGTFYVAPSIMRQLFSIHGTIGGQVVPLLFCLMSKKSKMAYEELFYELCFLACESGVPLKPERIITDFEIAISSAAKLFFPTTEFKGCIFHFGQILWRQLQKQGMAQKYGNDEYFNLQVRMLKSLAFVPSSEIISYFNNLNKYVKDPEWQKLAKWFKKNYIVGTKNVGPRYSPEFWCIGDRISQHFPRTQNSVEGWHNRLKILIRRKNCGLYAIIKELQNEMLVILNNVEKIKSGEVPKKKKKLLLRFKHIKNIIKKRENTDMCEFLKLISYNISLC